jgi:hypothetical protein
MLDVLLTHVTVADPDQFTSVPAELKIIKVLIEELLSASGAQNAQTAALAAEFADEEADDDSWEDVPSILDLGSGMKFLDSHISPKKTICQ